MPSYNYNLTVVIGDIPPQSFSPAFTMDGFVKIEETVAAGDTVTVNLSPGPIAKIRALLAFCNSPDYAVTFKPASSVATIQLDQPYFASGRAAVSLLASDLDQIVLTNGSANDVVITMIAAKDA